MNEYPHKIIDGIKCYNPESAAGSNYYPPDVFDKLFRLEQANFWFVARNRLIRYFFNKYTERNKELKTLEIGCGTGFVLKELRKIGSLRLYGAEVLLDGLKLASERVKNAEFFQLDATRMQFVSEFDIICTFDVLEHIDDDMKVMSNVSAALKEKGLFFITVPQHRFLWAAIDELSGHKRRYKKSEILSKLRHSGFEILHVTSFVFSLFPFMTASRLINRKKLPKNNKNEEDLLHEFRIPGFLNKVFTLFMLADEMLIKIGLRLPFGGSLFVVSVKK